ncbi:MAG: Phosphonate-transporting ATPase [Blastococcus sp.]|nr:Phosphonate-transporting ATPase [Blastococcus sp.]
MTELRASTRAMHPARDSEPVIELTDVRKVYDGGSLEVAALRGIDLLVEPGAYLAIMGPSGSGKSTLMNILGCLDVPTGGTYRLAGEDVGTMDEEELAHIRNRRIGFVFQQFHLLSALPAWRNVELPLIYAGLGRTERRARALAALDHVGLADRADHRPSELSGGQQQRVAVARALVTEPALLLADEPTGNLDSSSTEDVLGLLAELSAAGSTIVLITHEADVAQAAGRIVHIRDGLLEEHREGPE